MYVYIYMYVYTYKYTYVCLSLRPVHVQHNIHKHQTQMSVAGFESTIPESERPQTQALECAATFIGDMRLIIRNSI